jgi:hypothetical protein
MQNLADVSGTQPLRDPAAVDAFWQLLPRTDPVAAQLTVSRALASLVAQGNPGLGELQAVLALDRRSGPLVDALLVNYLATDAESPGLEKGYWQAAFELSRSFAETYWYFLRSVRDRHYFRRWREYIPPALLRLLQQRQVELLLRPFVDELCTRFPWKELHEAYEYAEVHGLLHQVLAVFRCRAKGEAESTLEREYIHLLLLDLVNGAHFPPRDAFWANQQIPRWHGALTLARCRMDSAEPALVVDLNGDSGLTRSTPRSSEACLSLDAAAALAAIRVECEALRAGAADPRLTTPGRGKQLKLLKRLNALLATRAPFVARRGDRMPEIHPVEIVVGLPQIIGVLRNRRPGANGNSPGAAHEGQGNSLASLGRFAGNRSTSGDSSTMAPWSVGELDAGYPLWKLVDRSDSGCRLQGQIFESNWVIPGVLMAFRQDASAPWMVGVVRRFDKSAGDRADIGVEYMGRSPRGVKISIVTASDARSATSSDNPGVSIAAIYLPESARHPVMPIKTLVLPVRRYAPDDRLTLRSTSALYTIQLKEPIDEQSDFIWTPFEIIARRLREDAATAPSSPAIR